MKKVVIAAICLIVCFFCLIFGLDYLRESKMLKASGLDISRLSVKTIYSHQSSINFGADSREVFGYELPTEFSALSKCGTGGYSEPTKIDVSSLLKAPNLHREAENGCFRRDQTDSGVTYIFVLLDNDIFIKVF